MFVLRGKTTSIKNKEKNYNFIKRKVLQLNKEYVLLQSFLIKMIEKMYAIVDIAGQQFKVEEGRKIYVNRLSEEEGKKVNFDKVLLIDNDKSVNVGEPTVKGATVSAKIISHMKGDKVIVFKKKRRKGYKVRNGYRDYLTQIEIEKISAK